jgi:hypothetical protein
MTVVVVTALVGVDGGGADTTWDSGSEEQPDTRRPRAAANAKTGTSCLAAGAEVRRERTIVKE